MSSERTDSPINPWVRAEMELYDSDTEKLIPEGMQQEYTRILKELAHAKGIASLALGQLYLHEQERVDFFTRVQKLRRVVPIEEHRGKV